MSNKKHPEIAVILIFSIVVLLAGIWIAFDGKQYWHDVRFLYLASEFSYSDILAGTFNPHQAWTGSNEASSSGFYLSKMGHLFLLKNLFNHFPVEQGGFELAITLSVILMLANSLLAYCFFYRLFASSVTALYASICFWLTPLAPYLAGKILSENTSLFFVIISLILFSYSTDSNKKRVLFSIGAGIMLAMAALMRIDSLFGPLGFLLMCLFYPITISESRISRPMILLSIMMFLIVYVPIILATGLNLSNFVEYFVGFVTAGQKPVLMSYQGIATVGGSVYLLSVIGVMNKSSRLTKFLVVWLLLTAVPALFISWNSMVEPRYLVQTVIPLCGLAAIGVVKLNTFFNERKKVMLFIATVFVTLTVSLNYLVVRLMPYELDRPAILGAVAAINKIGNNVSILVPWSYTDYNFLRVVVPNSNIFNVNSSLNPFLDKDVEAEWKARFHRWYGEQYITEQAQVDELLKNGPVFYLGWRVYPPVQNIHDFATVIGCDGLVGILNGLQMTDHRKESWLWDSPGFNMQYSGRSGQYEYYRVDSAN